jgi:hypothetical protein
MSDKARAYISHNKDPPQGARADIVYCARADTANSEIPFRPRPGTDNHEIGAVKQSFAACGKLAAMTMGPRRIARSAQMPLDKSVPTSTTFSSPD